MGKVAVVNHGGSEITLSMVRWRARRLALFWGKKLGIINRFSIALFIPKYEIAVYDGGPKVVFSRKPLYYFYYPNAKIAFQKWDELAAIFAAEGLYGISDFIRAGEPRVQGVLLVEEPSFREQIERLCK
jgi:hypothetical protein